MDQEVMITLTINGAEIKAKQRQTILEVAKSAGIYIPSLCYYPGLNPLPNVMPE
ncbi:MAG: 2Fe-2S iron-sulfur cluster-binding protein [Chloroflexota bacterium]|nr:2Fe-2S iron-sulfur cluster-binding protein [Chloroflexota bacterium]